jgi:CDP-diacylglycerol--serine O-phosphatidyltransferase
MLVIGFIMAQAQTILFFLALGYAISGPVITLLTLRQKRQHRKV